MICDLHINRDKTMESPFILDIGGEGRHPTAWNLNPRTAKTLGPCRGEAIPNLIRGRGESIPLHDRCVDIVIVERTPLRAATLTEICRIAKPGSTIILRHAIPPWCDPHRLALRMVTGNVERGIVQIGKQTLRETTIRYARSAEAFAVNWHIGPNSADLSARCCSGIRPHCLRLSIGQGGR